jgi:3-isopropylmalate dehydratase small subunit
VINLSADVVAKLFADAQAAKTLEIDLPNQVVRREDGETIAFDIDPFRKCALDEFKRAEVLTHRAACLVNGHDDISLTLMHVDEIAAYEEQRRQKLPWFEGIGSGTRILRPTASRQGKTKGVAW